MTQLAAQAAAAHSFNEATLRQTLGAIARRSRATGEDIDRALEEGFRQGVAQAMSDGIITREEEERLRAFRDRLALENRAADQGALSELDRAGADRVVMEARLAAISVRVRYDKIVAFDPYDDGFGIMRDAQTAKHQVFRTGDGWFAYHLVTNLAQPQG